MKRIIQISSILILLTAFAALSVRAQTGSRIDAKIPFDFNIGNKSYEAGDYVIKTLQLSNSTVRISLADSDGKALHNFLVYSNGEVAAGDQRLIFDLRNNKHYLSKILTNDKGLLLKIPEPKKLELAKRL